MYGKCWLPFLEGFVTFYIYDNCMTDLAALHCSWGRGGARTVTDLLCQDAQGTVTMKAPGLAQWCSNPFPSKPHLPSMGWGSGGSSIYSNYQHMQRLPQTLACGDPQQLFLLLLFTFPPACSWIEHRPTSGQNPDQIMYRRNRDETSPNLDVCARSWDGVALDTSGTKRSYRLSS